MKQIEDRYIGGAVVVAIDKIFGEGEISTACCTEHILGFGMIGEAVVE